MFKIALKSLSIKQRLLENPLFIAISSYREKVSQKVIIRIQIFKILALTGATQIPKEDLLIGLDRIM